MTQPWKAIVLTLFPGMFPGPLALSVLGKALQRELWNCETIDIREFAVGKHADVDDTPAGGGAGMVMRADVISAAIEQAKSTTNNLPIYYLSARGTPFTQIKARELSEQPGGIFLCGRFEGIDERVLQKHNIEEISLGDYVITGGELASMVVIDAIVRLLPNVLGGSESLDEESFTDGLLEYPQYTRPRDWQGLNIPEILLSGDHKKIADWRHKQARELTKQRRPDLWAKYKANKDKSDKA